ncbi:MTRF1L release factor glutamine methyltransferase-like [Uranotaenia lowii]|uniref:MTRF1L release factor glutamine methyltransferase-like n=1 Tax=Uranotaenia lowii TaxID=190385 RepID=UPI0024796FC0|nr:MTRF1L release factor glutamine methyltransferase-like [Uranotaenia lowii]
MFLSRSGAGALRQYLKGRSIQAMLSSDALNSTTWAPNSVRTVQDQWRSRFEQEKIPEPTTSITNILAHVLKLACPGDVEKHQKLELSKEQLTLLADLCECRMARMPIQYVIGQWDFGELTLKMAPPVFIPRPETEELVELILQQIDTDKEFRFLEIGCGTGAIALSILSQVPNSTAIAIDQSKLACELTKENAENLGLTERLRIFKHKLVDKIPEAIEIETFDMIVSNPPYVPSHQLLQLEPEIKVYEDLRALDGGPDGLKVVKAILKAAAKHLKPKGVLWLEVDSSHPPLIATFLEKEGSELRLKYISSYKDLFKNERFVEVAKL